MLTYLMFLKQKRTGVLKDMGCAGGLSQKGFIGEDKSSSPIVLIYALMERYAINAIKGSYMVTCDIPGVFV